MGKFSAALIIAFLLGWLVPMCAQLPPDLTAVAKPAEPAPTPAPVPVPEPVAAPVPAPAPAPVAAPAPPPEAGKPAVVVIAYRMKKMFPITDGRGRVSVLVRNDSDQTAHNMRLTMNALKEGKVAETERVNTAFTIEAASSVYRGLFVSAGLLDAMLATPPEPGAELQWTLTYRLDGDAPEFARCYFLRAVPRPREPEGIAWTPLGSSTACLK